MVVVPKLSLGMRGCASFQSALVVLLVVLQVGGLFFGCMKGGCLDVSQHSLHFIFCVLITASLHQQFSLLTWLLSREMLCTSSRLAKLCILCPFFLLRASFLLYVTVSS